MGSFDRVTFECPCCHAVIEVQSKAGPCLMHNYHQSSVPTVVAVDINGEGRTCSGCGTVFRLKADLPARVHIYLQRETDTPGEAPPGFD